MPVNSPDPELLRNRIIGLGERSIHKSYYPELQNRLSELERFRSMLDQSSDIIFLVNHPDFTIFDVTSQTLVHIGWSPEELIGSSFWDILSEGTRDEYRGKLDTDWHDAQKREVFTSIVRQTIPMEFVCSPVTFEGQRFVIIVGQEIRQRLESEKQIRTQLFQLDTLHRIDHLITANLSLPDLLHGVLCEVKDALKADAVAVYIYQTPEEMECVARCGEHDGGEESATHLTSDQIPEMEYGECIIINCNDETSDRLGPIKSRLVKQGFTGYAGDPLSSQGKIRGILEVYYRRPLLVTDDYSVLLSRLSAQVTVAVDKSQMFNHLQQAYIDLNNAYDETLEGWVAALEMREKETADHSQKVVEMTIQLAHAMGFPSNELVQIRRGALLHDIGKMAIPDGILLKPGPLTEEEWIIMRLHPGLAYQMLSRIDYLHPALDIPYSHHEKWDGTGYPQGLAGEAIPLAARIFSVVDVWQALTSDRVYRLAWPEKNAVKYISDHSGTQFDPAVVDAFVKMLQKKED